jgi:hypothetical protein
VAAREQRHGLLVEASFVEVLGLDEVVVAWSKDNLSVTQLSHIRQRLLTSPHQVSSSSLADTPREVRSEMEGLVKFREFLEGLCSTSDSLFDLEHCSPLEVPPHYRVF